MATKLIEKANKPRAPKYVIEALEKALRASELSTYSPKDGENIDGVRIYLDAACSPTIAGLLAWAKGDSYMLDLGRMWPVDGRHA